MGGWGVVRPRGFLKRIYFFPHLKQSYDNDCFIKWRLKLTDGFTVTLLCLCDAYIFSASVFQLPPSLISQIASQGTRTHSDVGGIQAAFSTCPPPEPSESSTSRKSECDSQSFTERSLIDCSVRVNMRPVIMVTAIILQPLQSSRIARISTQISCSFVFPSLTRERFQSVFIFESFKEVKL